MLIYYMSDSNIVLSSASYKEIKHFIKEDLDAFKYSFNHLELKKSYSSNSLSNFMLFFNHDFLNYLKECDSSLEIYKTCFIIQKNLTI